MTTSHVSATQRKNIRFTILSIVIIIAVFFGLFLNKMLRPAPITLDILRENGIVLFQQPREVKAFSLIDQRGESLTKEHLKGKHTLLFFGFTHCPDICPTTLSDLALIAKRGGEAHAAMYQTALVTLDPARDTPEVLSAYIRYFNDDFIAATGEFKSIMSLTNNLNVAFTKVALDEGYTIDHTSHIAILNPQGDYMGYIKKPLNIGTLSEYLPKIVEF